MKTKPEIYQYREHVTFLKEWFLYKKATQRGFSLRGFAKRAGFSPALLPFILAGKRTLTEASLEQILPHMDLTPPEQNFFRSLRVMGESKQVDERRAAFQAIQKHGTYRKLNPKEFEVYRYMSRWHYVTIREMASMPDFQYNSEWIQERLKKKVKIAEIKKALRFLIEHGFIDPPSTQETHPAKHIECAGDVYREALTEFHRTMLSLAADSIQTTEREKRHITSFTIGMDQNSFSEVKAVVDEAMEKIRKITQQKETPDSVYHVTFAAFPTASKP